MLQNDRTIEPQSVIDSLLSQFDTVMYNEAELVKWIGRFAEFNVYVDLHFDEAALAVKLESAGYFENAEVGRSPDEIKSDKSMLARYLVGQAISNLRKGNPIQPVATVFTAAYAATT